MQESINSTLIKQQTPVATVSKRELAKAKTRRDLLKSALRLYKLEGSCGMSMNKVTQGAGIAQPSFYNHFASLEALQQELGQLLTERYLSPMRSAWVDMLQDYPTLSKEQFHQRCQHCLSLIFTVALQNIDLFQRLLEDRMCCSPKVDQRDLPSKSLSKPRSTNQGLGHLINDIQYEWTEIFIQGLTAAGASFRRTEVHLCVDMATAQVHELILGCYQQRYEQSQAIHRLSLNFDTLFASFFSASKA